MSNPSETESRSARDQAPASQGLASPSRRAFVVGAGGLLGVAATRGLGMLDGPATPPPGASTNEILRTLVASLNDFQRSQVLFPIDHPSRQVANTVSFIDRPHAGVLLSARQMRLVERLIGEMLSERGAADMAATFALEGDPRAAVLSIYGDPMREPAQALLAGGHFTLRAGAGGGAVAYGQQVGDGSYRIQGNAFARHAEAANAFLGTLSPEELRQALLPTVQNEFVLQPEAHDTNIPGVSIASLGEEPSAAFGALLEQIVGTFGADSRRQISPERLRFSASESDAYYEGKRPARELGAAERRQRGLPYFPIWRIEGPGVVIHFQGNAHVHSYVQIGDPDRPQDSNVGEAIARLDRQLGVDEVRSLHEAAMRRATGEALAFQRDTELGRLCAGEVTTGLVWTTEPFRSRIVVAEIRGDAMAEPLLERLREAGVAVSNDDHRYRIATTNFTASQRRQLGKPERIEVTEYELRDTLIAMIRAGALERA